MQIHFERSGGFAGLRLAHDIDSAILPADQEAPLKDLVEQSRFFELPAVLRAERPGADRFQYKLRLKGDSPMAVCVRFSKQTQEPSITSGFSTSSPSRVGALKRSTRK